MTLKIKNFPTISPQQSMFRMMLSGLDSMTERTAENSPNEVVLQYPNRAIGQGFRTKTAKAIILASYIPLFFLADMIAADHDYQGTAVWMICCVLVVFLFNWTSWDNDQPK